MFACPASIARLTMILMIILVTTALPASGARTPPWGFPDQLPSAELKELLGRDGVCLDLWFDGDLRYDAGGDGIRGSWTTGRDVWLRDSRSLEQYARVGKYLGPLGGTADIRVEILPGKGGAPRRVKDKDLVWRGTAAAGGGIVNLDVMVYTAVVPGLQIGDRLRITEREEWRGSHYMPLIRLRTLDEGWVRAVAAIRVPAPQELSFSLVGSDSLAAVLVGAGDHGAGGQSGAWELRDHRTGDWHLAEAPAVSLTIVTHVVDPEGARKADAFVGAADWKTAASGYVRRVEPMLTVTPEVRDLATRLIVGEATTSGRITALYRHVQVATRYLGLYSGQGGIIPAAAADTHRLGYGDCKGLAAYLIALCRAVGIDAWPVLLMTRDGGQVAPDVPNMGQFNHFIVWADDGLGGCWLDPTLEGIPAGALVAADAGSPVLMMKPGTEGLCEIPRAAWEPGRHVYRVVGELDERMMLHTTVALAAEGTGGGVLRSYVADLPAAQRKSQLLNLLLSPALRSGAAADPTAVDDSGTPGWQVEVSDSQPLPMGAGRVFLPTEIAPLDVLRIPPVIRQRRLDLREWADRFETWTLTLPETWHLTSADSFTVATDGLAWSRSVTQSGRELRLQRELLWPREVLDGAAATRFLATLREAGARERQPILLRRVEP